MIWELSQGPLAYYAAVVGLFCATAIIFSSMLFLLKFAVEQFRLMRYRYTFVKLAKVMHEVAIRNEATNPEISILAKLIVRQVDPNSDLYKEEEGEIYRRLNLEPPHEPG